MLRRLIGILRGPGEEKRRAKEAGLLYPESLTVVTFDDAGVRGEAWSIAWPALERVEIHTTDAGPLFPDVFWVLRTASAASAAYAVPQGATGETELFERLQKLPGFDNEAVIAAMGSVENRSWVCWTRDG